MEIYLGNHGSARMQLERPTIFGARVFVSFPYDSGRCAQMSERLALETAKLEFRLRPLDARCERMRKLWPANRLRRAEGSSGFALRPSKDQP